MNLTQILLIGLSIGIAARFLRPGRRHMSLVLAVTLGVAGAFIATLGGKLLGLYEMGAPATMIGAAAGAVLLLFMASLVRLS